MHQFSLRQNKVLALLDNNSTAYIFAGDVIMRSHDDEYPFYVDRNFLYLTGLSQAESVLKLTKDNFGNTFSTLYLVPNDPVMAKWVGSRLDFEQAKDISGVDRVTDVSNLISDFMSLYRNNRQNPDFKIYFDLYRYQFDADDKACHKFIHKIKEKLPSLNILDIYPIMKKIRLIKDEVEIDNISKAIKITKNGILSMMASIKPNMNERVVQGVFEWTLSNNLSSHAFHPICASGINATILHYNQNNQVINDGDLFLCDLGARFQEYQADISRTFPVNGIFSPRQKEIYNLVLEAQNIVFGLAKPGVSLRQLQKAVVDFYRQTLPNHGLLEDVSNYYFHGVSHQLGLDTHDFSDGNDCILEPGMVITNEPGLYIEAEGIGIRIEDDLLITHEGNINLSKDIIKSVEDIENFMARNKNEG